MFPVVRLFTVNVFPLTQPICVSAAHVPLYTAIVKLVVVPVTFKKLIVCSAPVAVKEYHTSSFQPLAVPHVGLGSVVDCVALLVVPAVTVPHSKFGFTVRGVAFIHSSFEGGIFAVTQIPNVPTSPPKPQNLI